MWCSHPTNRKCSSSPPLPQKLVRSVNAGFLLVKSFFAMAPVELIVSTFQAFGSFCSFGYRLVSVIKIAQNAKIPKRAEWPIYLRGQHCLSTQKGHEGHSQEARSQCPVGCLRKTLFRENQKYNPSRISLGVILKGSKRFFDFDKV